MGLLFVGLVLFVMLVIVHEMGHFFAARRGDVEVEEFGLGFPPKLYGRKFKKHKTEYTINLLPLGGFVRLKGEHDADTSKHSFGAAKLSTKVKILLAGVGMNLATAWFLFLILAMIGLPQLPLPNGGQQFRVASDSHLLRSSTYISYVEPGSPAETAKLEPRDKIISIQADCGPGCDVMTQEIQTSSDLSETTHGFAGQPVVITFERNGQISDTKAMLRTSEEVESSKDTDNPKGYLGVSPYTFEMRRSTWSAPVVATGLTIQFTKLTLQGLASALGNLLSGHGQKASESVSGPVGIFFVLKDGSSLGFQYTLLIIALLSLTLAIMNVLPIPALDGGRLFVMLLFRVLKKPLLPKTEERIHATGFVALISLIIVITFVDVGRFF